MAALIPIDAEVLVVDYLSEVMSEWTVATRVPEQRSGSIKVEQTGGGRPGHATDTPMITVQTWHDDAIEASRMCREALARLWSIRETPHGHLVRSVTVFGGPQPFPDPDSDCPRWQVSVQLNIRPTMTGEPT